MINKKEFVKIINNLKEVNDFVEETNSRAKKLNDVIISDFYNTMSLSISHEYTVVKLLENIFNDKDIISWWLYECDYGRNFKVGDLQVEGKQIDLTTSEKLYDYLIEEMEMNTNENTKSN